MENIPADPPQEENTSPTPGGGWLYWSLALALSFMVGLVAGFLGRPAVVGEPPITVVVTVVPEASNERVSQADNQSTSEQITPVDGQSSSSSSDTAGPGAQSRPTPTIMDLVLSDARHFQGSADAPIVMVEFSDFK